MQKHPAPFSKPIIDRIREMLADAHGARVLDPFAGTMRVLLAVPDSVRSVTAIEIEEEFVDEGIDFLTGKISYELAAKAECVVADSAVWLRRHKKTYTHAVTSPTYGNRMSDPYRSKEGVVCRSYAQSKGGALSEANTGRYMLHDPKYFDLNVRVMAATIERLVDGGVFILNVSDFYRTLKKGQPPVRVDVLGFWLDMMRLFPVHLAGLERVYTRRYKHGENRHRVPYEYLVTFRKD